MKSLERFMIPSLFVISFSVHSQELRFKPLNQDFIHPVISPMDIGTPSHDIGILPFNLENMVLAADVIVLGRYGQLIEEFSFLGYGETVENLAKTWSKYDEREIEDTGRPMTDYGLVIDEIIKDNTRAPSELVLRINEVPGTSKDPDVISAREGTHIFFLTFNPDGDSFGLQGLTFDLKDSGDTFSYTHNKVKFTVFESHDKVAFLSRVKEIVRLQSSNPPNFR